MHTRRRKQKHNKICIGHHYKQANTINVNKTSALLQTTEGKDEPNIVFSTLDLGVKLSDDTITFTVGKEEVENV